jgi:hypothetical protein
MFSLGTKPKVPVDKRQRQKNRIKKAMKKTPKIRIVRRHEQLAIDHKRNTFESSTRWRLLPQSICGPLTFLFDFNDASLSSLIRAIQEYPLITFGEKKSTPPLALPTTEAATLFQRNQRLRFCLKSFFNRMRISKFRFANDVDPVTFDAPKHAIHVADWTQKRIYLFEAATLLGDIRTRLQHHDYLFPEPLFPRNLITNLPFTLYQTMSIYQQLLRHGHMHWTLESFRHSEYNLKKFALLNHKQLYLKALYYSVYSDNDKELLLDFIELQHSYHGYTFDTNLYTWAVYSKPGQHSKRIDNWKRYCYEYHEATALYEDTDEQIRRLNRISFFTSELCKFTHELRELKAMTAV